MPMRGSGKFCQRGSNADKGSFSVVVVNLLIKVTRMRLKWFFGQSVCDEVYGNELVPSPRYGDDQF